MNVKLNGKLLEEVDCFKCFGSQVAADGGCGREKCMRGQCSQRRCVLLWVSGGLREESECARDEEFEKKKLEYHVWIELGIKRCIGELV